MSRIRVAPAIALLLLCANPLFADEPLEAILIVPDRRILPGVPFDFWVEIHNRSETMRRFQVCAPFHMRLVAGEPIHWTETAAPPPRNAFYWVHGGEAVVAPGATAVLAIPASDGMRARDFFRDQRLSSPGRRFEIALPLCELSLSSFGSAAETSKLMTTAVEIEVAKPVGSDAAVWKLMSESGQQPWTAADMGSPDARPMWELVLRDFPDSNYIPYAVLMTGIWTSGGQRDNLARQLRAIQRFSDSPALEWLRVEAWWTARTLQLRGVMLAEGAIVRSSKRPTTRLLASDHEPR